MLWLGGGIRCGMECLVCWACSHPYKVAGNGILPGLHVELDFSPEFVKVKQQKYFQIQKHNVSDMKCPMK